MAEHFCEPMFEACGGFGMADAASIRIFVTGMGLIAVLTLVTLFALLVRGGRS